MTLRRIFWVIFGKWCETHDRGFRSDFCGECFSRNLAREQARDRSPEWVKSEWPWPLVKGE